VIDSIVTNSSWPALYIDTETSDYHEENSPSLPVQVAAILAGENRILATLCCLISQRMWQGIRLNPIAQRVTDIHQITPDMCDAFGWPPDLVIGRLRQMAERAAVVVAHNCVFDVSVLRHMCSVQRVPPVEFTSEFCTMVESSDICRLPSRGRYDVRGYKAPKLAEAYRFFAKREMTGAHDALYDVMACRTVYRGILAYREKEQQNTDATLSPGQMNTLNQEKPT
jgi:DNA polymerase III subunit epsilon